MDSFDFQTLFWATGLVGVACYLTSYTLLQAGVIVGAGLVHTLMNLMAASLVLVSLAAEWNMSTAVIQISWIVISTVGLTRLWLRARRLRFSEEEERMRAACLATMPRSDARRVLDLGVWLDVPEGYRLTEQDMPVEHVYFLQSGTAEVCVDGMPIAHVRQGGLIGEMGGLTHGAASATVTMACPSRLFRVSSDALALLMRRAPELRPHLEYAFAHATRQKLLETNASLRDALHRVKQIDRVA